ncbi:MAG: hypothetical protein J6113_09570, partial [Lachnospiraceae bacterium]|nr:hypothetical protein [Lachnospiraceae bacterium]
MKMRKRLISSVLAFVLALLLVPVFGAKASVTELSSLYTNPDNGYDVYIGTSVDKVPVNLRTLFTKERHPDGTYNITMYAYSPDGVQVSNYSNTLQYEFVRGVTV